MTGSGGTATTRAVAFALLAIAYVNAQPCPAEAKVQVGANIRHDAPHGVQYAGRKRIVTSPSPVAPTQPASRST